MRFMLRVEVADVTDDWAVLGEPHASESVDGRAPGLARPVARPRRRHRGIRPGRRAPRHRARLARGDRATRRSRCGSGRSAARRHSGPPRRCASPRGGHGSGFETDHRTIAHEVDWLRTAVHLHKGCYRGQETVARVHNLGRPPRRLVFLHLDGSGHVLPAQGSEVRAGDRVVGHVTSVARHHDDGPIALAVIKRNTDPTLELLVDDLSAAQTIDRRALTRDGGRRRWQDERHERLAHPHASRAP